MNSEHMALWLKLLPGLNEVQRRWYAGQKAIELGRGGIQRVHELTGISRPTIMKGIREIKSSRVLDPSQRLRRLGGGRKSVESVAPDVVQALEEILNETTAGDPMSAITWTTKSARAIAQEMTRRRHPMQVDTACRLLRDHGYSLQGSRRTRDGERHPGRDDQFCYLNMMARKFLARGEPVISVETRKKERAGEAEETGIPHDARDAQRDRDIERVLKKMKTYKLAVESIFQWWSRVGKRLLPNPTHLLIVARGGANGIAAPARKSRLQQLSKAIKLPITVCQRPPGTSRWNNIEHRMLSSVSLSWRGRPPVDFEIAIDLVGSARTQETPRRQVGSNRGKGREGVASIEEEMATWGPECHEVDPTWSFTVSPRPRKKLIRGGLELGNQPEPL